MLLDIRERSILQFDQLEPTNITSSVSEFLRSLIALLAARSLFLASSLALAAPFGFPEAGLVLLFDSTRTIDGYMTVYNELML